MTFGQFLLALFLISILGASHLWSNRYQTTSTHDLVYVIDTFTGDINGYAVGASPTKPIKLGLFATHRSSDSR